MADCVVSFTDRDQQTAARQLAAKLHLACEYDSQAALQLVVGETGLALFSPALGNPVQVDFVSGKNAHRRQFGGGRGQPLAKALGLKQGARPTIIDATAGLGRDAFVLASLGCQVTLIEQQPILVALLADGIERAAVAPAIADIVARMHLQASNAVDFLQTLAIDALPDVIYLDPMYPSRDKTALVKKDMQLLHQVVGMDQQGPALLDIARQRALKRIVVKRPKGAPLLNDIKPVADVSSKNTRYDIYAPVKI